MQLGRIGYDPDFYEKERGNEAFVSCTAVPGTQCGFWSTNLTAVYPLSKLARQRVISGRLSSRFPKMHHPKRSRRGAVVTT
jgi:hypothetical protein